MSSTKEVRYTSRSITPPRRRSRSASPPKSRARGRSRSVSPPKSRARSRSRSRDSVDVTNPGNNLYITGLSTRVNNSDLEKYFSKEGKVLECHVVTDPRTRESRGFAFVTMETVEDADHCIKYLNRSVLEGRIITVEKAKRSRGRTPTPGNYRGSSSKRDRRRSRSRSPYRSRQRDHSYSRNRRERSYSPHARESHRRCRERSMSAASDDNHRAH